MSDTEKLNALIDYIRDAERYHLDNSRKGSREAMCKVMAVQDILTYMEHELGIEYVQLPSKIIEANEDYQMLVLEQQGGII